MEADDWLRKPTRKIKSTCSVRQNETITYCCPFKHDLLSTIIPLQALFYLSLKKREEREEEKSTSLILSYVHIGQDA